MLTFLAYENITDHATDEYMAIMAEKTMQFVSTQLVLDFLLTSQVRAPDENVFIARPSLPSSLVIIVIN